ncbi:DUF805 domain-containing protein [Shewanella sp. 1_MG-2023]|uniref:DUF805 domain-containing protein n=1 Tax=unclassified Shewanella TaxID=196818 RepID=UPI0026E28267|nr:MULTISPECIES: DUF805 domain-containing protein [unclassified Shewanella]MDO6610696.1 DUF805 domain-containing protein [Shewanella sp. 7_MG-2023]MDO6770821.1 DUF805 domain-containing protein [Shewanella sp. 2_MG-2023]MDO6793161.1 DUF805 domain-containing protein [Shewanella sp. 1_MG-2023]
MDWYIKVLKNYINFKDRARRKEYWFFVLFNLIAGIVLGLIDNMTGTLSPETGYGLLSGIYSLLVFLPGLGVTVRRLHDSGRTGWWILIGLIPLIGALVLLYFLVSDSEQETNQYGPNPKGFEYEC